MHSIRPRLIPSLVLATLLAMGPVAASAQQPIEQQMTPEQVKATGLDKLSPQELANLNAWLNDKLEVETTKAATAAKEKVETENRGFAAFGRSDPIVAKLVGEFRGFARGRSYTLDNGQVWQQVDEATLAGVRKSDPQVRIKPSLIGNAWYMQVDGYNKAAMVQRTK